MQSNLDQAQSPPLVKAFVSHSSADKERIVNTLDKLLCDRGFDVWLDERDLLPGKNIVDEIFTHGISRSDVFIVVLSKNSIDRPWVRAELTNAVVQKIDGVVKMIIPIVLDDVTPPDYLKDTVWERIADESKLPMHADRIAASVFGRMPAPVAPAPAYAGIPIHQLSGLHADDERVFAEICRQTLGQVYHPIVDLQMAFGYGASIGMSEAQVGTSIAALAQQHYLRDLKHYAGENHPLHARLTEFGLSRYLESYEPERFRSAKRDVVNAVVNNNTTLSREISRDTGVHEAIVELLLRQLESAGQVRLYAHTDGITIIPQPTLSRAMEKMD